MHASAPSVLREAMHVAEAAAALGVRPDTLRAWIRRGAPVVQPGSPGPGRGALVDLDAVRGWRARGADGAPVLAIDAELIARGALSAFRDGMHRDIGLNDRQAAALLVEAWAHTVREATGHPPRDPVPEQIAMLIAVLQSLRPARS